MLNRAVIWWPLLVLIIIGGVIELILGATALGAVFLIIALALILLRLVPVRQKRAQD